VELRDEYEGTIIWKDYVLARKSGIVLNLLLLIDRSKHVYIVKLKLGVGQ